MRVSARRGHAWVVMLLATLGAGCYRASAQPAARGAPRVSVDHPQLREIVDEDDYTGWLAASATVEVRSRVRGHIAEVLFQDGDLVKEGQLLFRLDQRPFQAAVDEALAQAQAVRAQQNAAEKDVVRYTELVKSRTVSQQEYEKVVADAQSYAAAYNARLQELEKNKLDLEFANVKAEISGRIGRALLTKGNLVNAGGSDPVLATIVALDPLYVYFTIDERSLQRYQKNRRTQSAEDDLKPLREQKIPFRFGLDTDEGYPHAGYLDFADNKVDPSTGTIEIRGVVKNERQQFVPGSRVRVRVPVSDPYEALLVPDTAVMTDQDQKYVFVLNDKNEVKRCNLRLGRLLDDGMRIVLGAAPPLTKDDRAIVEGFQAARPNYPVEPIEATPRLPPAGEAPAG